MAITCLETAPTKENIVEFFYKKLIVKYIIIYLFLEGGKKIVQFYYLLKYNFFNKYKYKKK